MTGVQTAEAANDDDVLLAVETPENMSRAPQTYSAVAIWLHWTIAGLLIANLGLGVFYDAWGKPAAAWLMFFHKSIGIAVLALTVVRLGWRLLYRPPPFDAVVRPWESALAKIVHATFYLLLLAVPVTGWMFSSSWGKVSPFFGLFEVPALPVPTSEWARTLFGDAHELLGYATMLLIALHVAGALKHHAQGHRHVIGRMAPVLSRS